jgi:hypothetical protein
VAMLVSPVRFLDCELRSCCQIPGVRVRTSRRFRRQRGVASSDTRMVPVHPRRWVSMRPSVHWWVLVGFVIRSAERS